MPKRYLITGACGFIGSHLADYLVGQDDALVFGIDNLSTGSLKNIKQLKDKQNFIFTKADIRSKKLRDVIDQIRPDYVFHLAALARIQPSIEDPIKWNENNATATLNLLEACRQVGGVKKIVYSSSSSVYGDNKVPYRESQIPMPKNPYALSKLQGEQWCKLYHDLYGLDTTVLRYFNVFGIRQVLEGDYATVVGIFLQQQKEGKNLTIVGDGEQKRDFSYIYDVVMANIMASKRKGFGLYNIGTGTNIKIKDLAKMIEPDTTKHTYGIKRTAEAQVTLAKNKKARKELGWRPIYDIKSGIEETKDYGKEWNYVARTKCR